MDELTQFIHKLTKNLRDVTCRKAYGLDSFYVREKIFLAITKEIQVALKIEDYETQLKINQVSDIKQWIFNGKKMDDWYLLPVTFNKKKNRLSPIIEMVYKTALNPKKKKISNKSLQKKPAKKSNNATTSDNRVSPTQQPSTSFLRKIFLKLFS